MALVTASLLFSLVVLESTLRIGALDRQRQGPTHAEMHAEPRDNEWTFFEYDSLLGWQNRPNAEGWFAIPDSRTSVRINRRGLRDPDHRRSSGGADGRRFRILVLGDSFTWGFGVEQRDRFTDRLAAMLGPRVEVINAGVSGYGTDQELLYYEQDGFRYRAGLVLVEFGLEDVINNHSSVQYGYPKPYFVLRGDRLLLRNVPVPRRDAEWHERFGLPPSLQSRAADQAAPEPRALGRWTGAKLFLRRHVRSYGLLADRVKRLLGRDTPAARNGSGVDRLTVALMDSLRHIVETAGGRLAVVIIPYRQHLQRDVNAEVFDAYDDYWRFRGQDLVELRSRFQRSADGEELYFRNDPHWSPAGHALAARELCRYLVGARLLPRSAVAQDPCGRDVTP